MKVLRSIKMLTALILTLAFIVMVPLQTVGAAENNGKYVSEVYVVYGEDPDHARDELRRKGFSPIENNLNEGGKTFVMMGYKTTDDIRDSITDLAVMNMRGDYSVEDYKTLLKSQKNEIAEFLTEFMAVIKEYRANLKAGKTRAKYVHDILNNYTEDDTGMKMGDLLNSETLQDKAGITESIEAENPDKLPNLITILLQGNTQVIKSVEVLLSMATDTADNSWLDRFAELDYDTLLDKIESERSDLNTETKRKQYLDNVYGDDAAALGLAVSELRGRLTDYETSKLNVETATEEDIKKTFGDIDNDVDAMMQYQGWLSIGAIYEGLKNYEGGNYAQGELLGFFLEENDPEDAEIYIPMAAALSDGQRYGLPFVNLEQLLKYAFTSDEGWKKFVDQNKASFEGVKSVSVYQHMDRDIYKDDGSVALTSAAQRANNTAEGTTGSKEAQLDTLAMITAISWAATAGSVVAAIISTSISNGLVKDFAFNPTRGGWVESLERVIYDEKAYADFVNEYTPILGGSDKIMAADKVRYAVKISNIFITVAVFLIVASTVLTIIDLERDKSVEQLPIPNYLVDNYTDADGGSYALNYKAVQCNREEYFGKKYKKQKGSCADILADEGKQWLVLYASKNSKAGKPLTPDFVIQESITAPSGFEGSVHLIGEKGAVNVTGGAFRHYTTQSTIWQNITGEYSKYIFTKLSSDVKTYDESAGNMTASSVNNGLIALWGFGGLALGAVLGVAFTILIKKNKKEKETA